VEASLGLPTSQDEPLQISSTLYKETHRIRCRIAAFCQFGAESQLFVSSTALEYLAVWSIFTTTASAFSSHVVTTRPTVKQAWSCQRINAHGFTPFDVLDEMKPYMSSGHAKRLLNIK